MMITKLVMTALLSLAVGAAGTYALTTTINVTARCAAVPGDATSDAYTKQFLSQPALPMTGNPAYK
jgi:hypothetical protein